MSDFIVNLTEDDLYRGFRLHAGNRRARPALLGILLCLVLIALLLALDPGAVCRLLAWPAGSMLVGAVLLAALLLVVALAVRGPVWRNMARRTLEQRRELGTPITWAFDEAGLRIVTRFTRSEFPWDALRGWREDEHLMLIYLADHLFHSVPKAQVEAAALDGLRAALTAHGVPRR
jgi:hypothetical protein